MRNKIPYNLFEKWYKDTRHKIVPAHVESLRDFHDMNYNMSSEEKSKLLCELMAIHLRDEKRNEELMAKIDELLERQRQMSDFKSMFEESEKQARSKDVLIENLLKKITALEEAVRLNNKHTYGSKSQKRDGY